MASTVDKVKHALHLDKDKTHTTHTTGTTTGHSTTSGTAEGVAGPHSSRMANAADPRVDSDLDGSRNAGAHGVGYTGQTTGTGTAEGVAGPHSSRIANAADPRVDSDLDGSRNAGAHGVGYTGQTTGTGRTGTDAYSGTHAGNTTGTHTGTTGGISHSTNAGPHNSNLLNKADPRVDSDLDGRGNRHGAATGGILGAPGSHATAGSGTAQNTAGPHNSDMINKVDPRVDSDRDGSKTYGGNQTHA